MAVNNTRDPLLTNYMVDWAKERPYVFNQLPDPQPVDSETFRIPVFDKENVQRQTSAKRGTRDTTQRSHSKTSYISGLIDTAFKLEEVITPADVKAEGDEDRARRKAVKRLSRVVFNEIEIHLKSILDSATTSGAAAAAWASGGATDAIGDMVKAIEAVYDGTFGLPPTHIIMPAKTARRFTLESDVQARTKGSVQPSGISMPQLQDMLSELAESDIKLIVNSSGYASAAGAFTPIYNDTSGAATVYVFRMPEDPEDIPFMGGWRWDGESGVVVYDNPDKTTGGEVIGVKDIRKYVKVVDGGCYRITGC